MTGPKLGFGADDSKRRAGEARSARCSTCAGQGCEEGCGTCDYVNAGPNSHKVCRSCGGSGKAPQPQQPRKELPT